MTSRQSWTHPDALRSRENARLHDTAMVAIGDSAVTRRAPERRVSRCGQGSPDLVDL